jgi:hypothetical protein
MKIVDEKDDDFDEARFNFEFAVAVTMRIEHVDYDTAVDIEREELREN